MNGRLHLHDVFRLNLNAELVALSACETAIGRYVRGEGLIGLTQGFLYAGGRRLAISQWQVSDAASAVLMRQFYANMFDGEAPQPPAVALRNAQMTIRAERKWRDPYFWGGFVLLGEWK